MSILLLLTRTSIDIMKKSVYDGNSWFFDPILLNPRKLKLEIIQFEFEIGDKTEKCDKFDIFEDKFDRFDEEENLIMTVVPKEESIML